MMPNSLFFQLDLADGFKASTVTVPRIIPLTNQLGIQPMQQRKHDHVPCQVKGIGNTSLLGHAADGSGNLKLSEHADWLATRG